VKPVIYITCNEIKCYFNLCRATNDAHIKSYLRYQKIWGFLQILKHVITFFSFIYYSLLHPERMNFFIQQPFITGAELPFLIFYYSKKQCAPLHGTLLFINQCMRSVQKVSVSFEYLENWSHALDVTWQPEETLLCICEQPLSHAASQSAVRRH
jgi:hypothetical protein